MNHDSDCALHNGPAYPPGPCDCSVLAKQLWDSAPSRPHSPAWEQLGDTTQGVWLERAQRVTAQPLAFMNEINRMADKLCGVPITDQGSEKSAAADRNGSTPSGNAGSTPAPGRHINWGRP